MEIAQSPGCSELGVKRQYFARELVSYDDDQLDQYLRGHTHDDKLTLVEVEDPKNLPQSFIERLRRWGQQTTCSHEDQSRPVDPAQLISRLLDVSAHARPPRLPDLESPGGSKTPSLRSNEGEENEERRWDDLVDQGGRPLYPRDRIYEIMKDPSPHWDMLRPWLGHDPPADPDLDPVTGLKPDVSCAVFGRQLSSWIDFRCWQKLNRGDSTLRSKQITREHQWFVRRFRRPSTTYTEAVTKLLAEYEFIGSFHFHEDPLQQDQLITWIEYVGFLYWRHHFEASRVKALQPAYDAAWQKLVDSSVLRPSETEESALNNRQSIQDQCEADRAYQAVESAEAGVQAVLASAQEDINNPTGSRLTSETHSQLRAAAESKLQAAKQTQAELDTRCKRIVEFRQSTWEMGYDIAQRNASGHYLKARWALDQIPIIEAELKDPGLAELSPEAMRGIARSIAFEVPLDPMRECVFNGPEPNLAGRSPATDRVDRPDQPRATPKRRRDDIIGAGDDAPSSKRLRFSDGETKFSHIQVPDLAGAGSAAESHVFGVTGMAEPLVHESAAAASSNRLRPKMSTRSNRRSSISIEPLRRSARIAARQTRALQPIVDRSGVVEGVLPRQSAAEGQTCASALVKYAPGR